MMSPGAASPGNRLPGLDCDEVIHGSGAGGDIGISAIATASAVEDYAPDQPVRL
jgi:hypothetical protein